MSATVGEPVAAKIWVTDRRVAWAYRVLILLAIVGVFGTWRTTGPVSLDGLEGPHNGWEVIIFGLIALTGVGPSARGGWLGTITVFGCAVVMVYTAVSDLIDDGDVLGGSSGWGVWLTISASAALAGVAVLSVVRRVRRMRAGARPDSVETDQTKYESLSQNQS